MDANVARRSFFSCLHLLSAHVRRSREASDIIAGLLSSRRLPRRGPSSTTAAAGLLGSPSMLSMLSVALSVTTLPNAVRRVCAALAAVLFFTLLLSLAHLERFGLPALAVLVLLVVLAARRPATTLLVLTTVIPVAAWLGRRWDPSVAWAEALVVAFAAGYCARGAATTRGTRDEFDLPVLLSAAVIVASLIVQFLVDGWRFGGTTVRDHLWQLVKQDYLRIATTGDAVDAAMRFLESLLLFRAASAAARADATFGPLLVRSFVFGASAAAAANVLLLWEGAVRLSSPVTVFGRYLLTLRFNAHYGDLNAAGSYFAMAVFPAVGLASRHIGRWGIAALLIAASLWIAGSRAAFLAALVAMIVPAAVPARRISGASLRRMTAITAALTLMLVAVGMMRYLPERGNQKEPSTALEVRWQLARTSFRMLATDPAFGVGIGRYYSRSGEFSSPDLLKIFPPAIHENAHNNFLQILAELGIVGLTTVIWLLFLAARACGRLLRADPHDPLRGGIVIGLLAFVVSWLGGHPLLIDEPAFLFWVLLGTACGWGTPASTGPRVRSRSLSMGRWSADTGSRCFRSHSREQRTGRFQSRASGNWPVGVAGRGRWHSLPSSWIHQQRVRAVRLEYVHCAAARGETLGRTDGGIVARWSSGG